MVALACEGLLVLRRIAAAAAARLPGELRQLSVGETPAGRIEMREDRLDVQPPYSLDVVLNKADGRILVWSSVKSDGKVLVRDGHIVEVRDTKWLSRCR